MTAPAPVVEAPGNFCRFDQGRLSRPLDAEPPSTLTCFVHDAFRALVLNERFSCIGGRVAVKRGAYRFALYDRMGSSEAAEGLARDLARFATDADLMAEPLTAFVASFVEPAPLNEEGFEHVLWSTLQQVNDRDGSAWADDCCADPESPDFSFSFAGRGYFIVGLHAGSSRLARRFAWPTLVFNPHQQFDRLRTDGHYARFQRTIRIRDLALQGTVNPMLRDFGEASEARQYSGRVVPDGWRCPFAAGNTGRRSGREG
jgi:FPC/CPF motif-containing protein YcgG